jgi:serine/threonine-protein kinase
LDAEHKHAKLADFGLAHIRRQGAVSSGEGSVSPLSVGPFPWMAPEQWTDQLCSPASDVFMLGATIAEAIIARRPWAGASTEVIISSVSRGETTPLPGWLPEDIRSLVVSCLHANPQARPLIREVHAQLQRMAARG